MSPKSRNTAWVSFDGRNRQELFHGDRYCSFQIPTQEHDPGLLVFFNYDFLIHYPLLPLSLSHLLNVCSIKFIFLLYTFLHKNQYRYARILILCFESNRLYIKINIYSIWCVLVLNTCCIYC